MPLFAPRSKAPTVPPTSGVASPRPLTAWAMWFIRAVGWCVLFGVGLGLLVFWYGQIISDRIHVLQFIGWLPSWIVLCVLGALLPLTLLTRVNPKLAPRRRRARALTQTLGVAFLSTCLFVVVFEMHWHRALGSGVTARPGSIRLVHWNQEALSITKTIVPMRDEIGYAPDVLLVNSNQPGQIFEQSLKTLARPYALQRHAGFVIASAFPILRSRAFHISLVGTSREGTREHQARRWMEDRWNEWAQALGLARREFPRAVAGAIVLIELDTRQKLGRTTTLWWVDLPSDPFAPRWANAKIVRARIDELSAAIDPDSGRSLLPPADIVIGDFNTPRGSASLDLITGSLPHAFDLAGWGDARSFPRTYPVIHVDHTFVSPGLSVEAYELIRPSQGDHWLQSVTLHAR